MEGNILTFRLCAECTMTNTEGGEVVLSDGARVMPRKACGNVVTFQFETSRPRYIRKAEPGNDAMIEEMSEKAVLELREKLELTQTGNGPRWSFPLLESVSVKISLEAYFN